MTYGILVSGNLGKICLDHLLPLIKTNFVMTDSRSKGIIDTCFRNNIPVFAGNPRNGATAAFLQSFKTDVLLSINYLFIIEQDILQHPGRWAVNFHGSLLPKYRGRTPHVWAIINNETETGITAHLMTENCDEGDIVLQQKIAIPADATGASILEKFTELYPSVVEQVVRSIETNQLQLTPQDNSKATYFGKRTPEDGRIDWNWHKERIRNWVRAQADPYPGAFTYYYNTKVVINRIDYSDHSFHYQDTNGKILMANGQDIIVKTPNGAVHLTDIVAPENISFKTGEHFHG